MGFMWCTAGRPSILTGETLEQRVRELATPLDFNDQIQAGVSEKRRDWHKILSKDELPPSTKQRCIRFAPEMDLHIGIATAPLCNLPYKLTQ
jgi:hypothetical protein